MIVHEGNKETRLNRNTIAKATWREVTESECDLIRERWEQEEVEGQEEKDWKQTKRGIGWAIAGIVALVTIFGS